MNSKRYVIPAIMFAIGLVFCLTAGNSAQAAESAIETPVDDATFEQILEYFTYDENVPLDPRVFG